MSHICQQSEKIGKLERGIEYFEDWQEKQNGSLQQIQKDLGELKGDMFKEISSRPPWSVAIAITILTTITCGLAVYVITKGG